MSSLREKIKMSQEERLQFLEKQISLQIGTINKDGSPHLTTMWYIYDGDNFIFLHNKFCVIYTIVLK